MAKIIMTLFYIWVGVAIAMITTAIIKASAFIPLSILFIALLIGIPVSIEVCEWKG